VNKFIRRALTGTIVLAGMGAISLKPVQAAIISGQVSGIWTFENDGPGGYQVGDPFTALYTYNDADLVKQITNTNNMTSNSTVAAVGTSTIISSYFKKDTITSAKLLSVVVNSGSFQQVYNDTSFNVAGFPIISWFESQVEQKENDVVLSAIYKKSTEINAGDCCLANMMGQYFYASRRVSQEDGIVSDESFAYSITSDYSGDFPVYPLYATTDQPVTFSSTEVPTPALLPGLIGLGVGALRKRKHQAIA
jgi:hypothetical protein